MFRREVAKISLNNQHREESALRNGWRDDDPSDTSEALRSNEFFDGLRVLCKNGFGDIAKELELSEAVFIIDDIYCEQLRSNIYEIIAMYKDLASVRYQINDAGDKKFAEELIKDTNHVGFLTDIYDDLSARIKEKNNG